MFSFSRYNSNLMYALLAFFVLVILPIQVNAVCTDYKIKHILVVNSYHKGLAWSDSLMDGIEDVFRQQNQYLCNLNFEFLYTKHISDAQHYENIFKLMAHKFENKKFDLIISSDDNALLFLLKYRKHLFPDTPIVFCGINDFNPLLLEDQKKITGLIETYDIDKTIKLIPILQPYVKKLVIITDPTTTGQALKKQVQLLEGQFTSIDFSYLEHYTMHEISKNISCLPEDTAIILISFVRDSTGASFNYRDSMKLISQNANVPIYVFRDFYVGYGGLGGFVKSGYSEGVQAAKLALHIMNNPTEKHPPIQEEQANKYMFDYQLLSRYKISLDKLPANSILINKPFSLYEENKRLFWMIVGFIAIQTTIIALLIMNILLRIKAQKEIIKFKTVADNASYGVLITSIDGRILYANDYYSNIHGYIQDELLKQNLSIFHKSHMTDIINTMQKKILTDGFLKADEIWHMRKDGLEFPMLMAGVLVRNQWNKPLYIGYTALDITDLKKAQERIQFLSSAIEQSKEGISVIDLNENYLFFNEAYVELHGFPEQELKSFTASRTYPSSEHQSLKNMFEEARKNGFFSGQMFKISRNGTKFPVNASCSLMKNDKGEPIAYVTSIRDITHQVQAEKEREELLATLASKNKELEKQNIELEQYAYTVSHDLKSPLVTINCFLEILRQQIEEENEASTEYIDKISLAATHMRKLLDDLLELSRIGRVINEVEKIDLQQLINDTITMLTGHLEKNNISLLLDINCTTVFADPSRLSEVLQNLLENAIKFVKHQKKPIITIGAHETDNEVICYIKDNGIGIEKRHIDKIFLLFNKLDPKTDGSGVGLTLVKRIIETHGGRIWAESEGKNMGTSIFFSLPSRPVHDNKEG